MSYYTIEINRFEKDCKVHRYETDSESLGFASDLINLVDSLDNGDVIRVTADIF